mmetsp:Transcript_15498/g.39233  ORF Transcript_15498/g.39233 Transcript_15498/m.39233 type:complete len:312 (-) Transcript_15498:1691-2626(-)
MKGDEDEEVDTKHGGEMSKSIAKASNKDEENGRDQPEREGSTNGRDGDEVEKPKMDKLKTAEKGLAGEVEEEDPEAQVEMEEVELIDSKDKQSSGHSPHPSPKKGRRGGASATAMSEMAKSDQKKGAGFFARILLFFSGIWEWYLWMLDNRPVRTKAVTAFIILGASDICAQALSRGEVELQRGLLMGGYGLLLNAPIVHYWYTLLDKVGDRIFSSPSGFFALVCKTCADQLLFSPLSTFMTLSYISTIVEGKGLHDGLDSAMAIYPAVLITSYKVWPALSLLSFKYIPTSLQVVFNNVAGFFWTIFLILA